MGENNQNSMHQINKKTLILIIKHWGPPLIPLIRISLIFYFLCESQKFTDL